MTLVAVPPDEATQPLYDAAIDLIEAEGADIFTGDIFGSAWLTKFFAAPSAPNSQRFDQWQYFQNLGSTTPFDSWETYQAELIAQGKTFVPSPFVTETTDTVNSRTTAQGIAWINWQTEIRTLFKDTLDTLGLDALAWPVNGAAAPTVATSGPGSANNLPLVQGIINILGVPGVILPAGEYADGTPFGIILIGRFWDEASLLGMAYDYEAASVGTAQARVVPTMAPEPSGVVLACLGMGLLMRSRRRAEC